MRGERQESIETEEMRRREKRTQGKSNGDTGGERSASASVRVAHVNCEDEWRQESREMKSVQDTGGRWTLHGLDASASDREDANRRTVGARKGKRDDPIRKSRVKESQDPRRRSEGESKYIFGRVRSDARESPRHGETIRYQRRKRKRAREREREI